jgi:hypothetical protein
MQIAEEELTKPRRRQIGHLLMDIFFSLHFEEGTGLSSMKNIAILICGRSINEYCN